MNRKAQIEKMVEKLNKLPNGKLPPSIKKSVWVSWEV